MELVKTFGFFFPSHFLPGGSEHRHSPSCRRGSGDPEQDESRDIIAMISYLEMLVWPLMGAGFTVNTIQRGAASLKRINDVLNTERNKGS